MKNETNCNGLYYWPKWLNQHFVENRILGDFCNNPGPSKRKKNFIHVGACAKCCNCEKINNFTGPLLLSDLNLSMFKIYCIIEFLVSVRSNRNNTGHSRKF